MQRSEQAEAHFQAAVAAHQRGDLDAAERSYREALTLAPDHPAASNNLGLCLAMSGRPEEAVGCFRQARRADPASADAAVNLAQALQQVGRDGEALDAWREAAGLLPQQMEPALAVAILTAEAGDLDGAVTATAEAASRSPRRDETAALFARHAAALAARCIDAGDLSNTHRLASTLLRSQPGNAHRQPGHDGGDIGAHLLEECLRQARVAHFDASLRDDLLRYHRSDAVEHQALSRVTCELLAAQYPQLLRGDSDGGNLAGWTVAGAHRDELLESLLLRGLVATAPLERALTGLRGALLREVRTSGALPDAPWRRFTAALALQCFANEYLFDVSDEEARCLAELRGRSVREPGNADLFALLACYRAPDPASPPPPARFDADDARARFDELVLRTLHEPQQERACRAQLADGAIDDAVSIAVRRQYEESPYPRWRNLEHQEPIPVTDFLRHEMPHARPDDLPHDARRILVAGCGTGAHALRVAARHPMCRVTAVDLSGASLAYAMRKAGEFGIGNVSFAQHDILALSGEAATYDLIESVGVLHHMRDPAAGLAALVDVLAPGGVIKLGLYSRRARSHVNRARARIAELGLAATPDGIRTLRQRIIAGDEPALEPLLASLDFYTMSAVRDLLFHVQEHQFDPRGLHGLLDGRGLRCTGFQVAAAARRRYLERFPADPALVNLEHWEAFETEFPDTFAGMYQFWCTRKTR